MNDQHQLPTDDEIDALVAAYLGDCGPQATRVYSFVRAVLAKWGAQPVVPAGYALVPVEPTPDMVRAGWELLPIATGDRWDAGAVLARSIYSTMLAAAPQSTQTQAVNQDDRPFIVRLAEDFAEDCVTAGYVTTKAASYGRLMDEVLSSQTQPRAVPLTNPEFVKCVKVAGLPWGSLMWELKRLIEEVHGLQRRSAWH